MTVTQKEPSSDPQPETPVPPSVCDTEKTRSSDDLYRVQLMRFGPETAKKVMEGLMEGTPHNVTATQQEPSSDRQPKTQVTSCVDDFTEMFSPKTPKQVTETLEDTPHNVTVPQQTSCADLQPEMLVASMLDLEQASCVDDETRLMIRRVGCTTQTQVTRILKEAQLHLLRIQLLIGSGILRNTDRVTLLGEAEETCRILLKRTDELIQQVVDVQQQRLDEILNHMEWKGLEAYNKAASATASSVATSGHWPSNMECVVLTVYFSFLIVGFMYFDRGFLGERLRFVAAAFKNLVYTLFDPQSLFEITVGFFSILHF